MSKLVTADLEKAVQWVLPALNLEPKSFKLDPGFLARAQRSQKPRMVAFNDISEQFVFLGSRVTADPDSIAESRAAEALASLGEEARACCESLVVGWSDSDDKVFAAAFLVLPGEKQTQLIASSWTPPDSWREPMIDASKSGEEMINEALDKLESIVRNRTELDYEDLDPKFERAVKLVDLALERVGGTGQFIDERPRWSASDEDWSSWMYYYVQSVLDEGNRVGVHAQRQLPEIPRPSSEGPLKGLQVFLSYARPEATVLAWPVHEALAAVGATVWFDRTQRTSKSQLALGLAEIIASLDVYILCASDEFFENAGYATQEFAWANQQHTSGGNPKQVLVVARRGTILPRAVAGWPVVELARQSKEELAREIISHLQPAVADEERTPRIPPSEAPLFVGALPPLPAEADLQALWRRIQHVRLYDEIDQATLTRLYSEREKDQRMTEVWRQLLHLGEGLDWSGSLADIDDWPEDPIIKDVRMRMATARAVLGTLWHSDEERLGKLEVTQDVEVLATQRVPIPDWPAVPGWADSERRFALRHHASMLRLLHDIFKRNLWGGLLHLPTRTLDVWRDELRQRRVECYDALLELRLNGRLSWQPDVPTWDALFRSCVRFLSDKNDEWNPPLPFGVSRLLIANLDFIAGTVAETRWYVSRYGGRASQSFRARGMETPVTIQVYTLKSGEIEDPASADGENRLRFGYILYPDRKNEIHLSWKGTVFSPHSPAGQSISAAPD